MCFPVKTIAILGGGAAGIAAAIAAAQQPGPHRRVILLERNSRVGKKLLATGNGRCNLSNTAIGPEGYFSSHPKAMAKLLQAVQAADPLGWLEDHGLVHRADEAGRIYPYSNQAADLLNLLLYWLEETKVEVRTDCAVAGLSQTGRGWNIALADGGSLTADAVICALGGSAGPQFGTEGFGTDLAAGLGLQVLPLYPCLVPLRCRKSEVSGLSGIRVKAEATLFDGDRPLRTEPGEIQFTDYGLSGIAVMQLSCLLSPAGGIRRPRLELDLFPHLSEKELLTLLHRHSRALPGTNAAAFMTGLCNRKVGLAVWKAQHLGEEKQPVAALGREGWQALAHGLKHWQFTQLEHNGWKNAQTTGGGLSLACLEWDSFALRGCSGLYFVGETVDCAGSCGGFNLHWAFGSGILAGQKAAASL